MRPDTHGYMTVLSLKERHFTLWDCLSAATFLFKTTGPRYGRIGPVQAGRVSPGGVVFSQSGDSSEIARLDRWTTVCQSTSLSILNLGLFHHLAAKIKAQVFRGSKIDLALSNQGG